MELHRGRLIDHIQLVTTQLEEMRRFYEAVLGALGIPIQGQAEDYFFADELFVSTPTSAAARGVATGRVHLAFRAKSRDAVESFHRAGLQAGGVDNGAPGPRPYHPGYYAAFLLDPAGNNLEAVHHGPAKQSADSVVISF
jgi:catechol 2,3-dioxygenase-like lactoylglutathione lyase family enzyme